MLGIIVASGHLGNQELASAASIWRHSEDFLGEMMDHGTLAPTNLDDGVHLSRNFCSISAAVLLVLRLG